jgi:putative transposase
LPARTHPAHFPILDHHFRARLVFVTVCAKDRKPIFATNSAHAAIVAAWRRASAWSVGRYVIMPDHIHFFCAPAGPDYPALGRWVQFWKAMATRQWPQVQDQPIWQPDHWDRQLRHGDRYAEKWEYIRQNPVRKGLVTSPDSWPYQGEMNVLWWHE